MNTITTPTSTPTTTEQAAARAAACQALHQALFPSSVEPVSTAQHMNAKQYLELLAKAEA